jgi:hypothetical protein
MAGRVSGGQMSVGKVLIDKMAERECVICGDGGNQPKIVKIENV